MILARHVAPWDPTVVVAVCHPVGEEEIATYPICVTCGVQHSTTTSGCKICEDERQYVGWDGQQWTDLPDMRTAGFSNRIEELEPRLWGIGTEPQFAIGQRSLLVTTPGGNVLWDPMSFLDQETIERLNSLGGIQAISASHPHFYGAIVEWCEVFGASIHLPAADREWVCREDSAYVFYDDLTFRFQGEEATLAVDDDFVWGARFAADIPLGEGGWGISLGARYLDTSMDATDPEGDPVAIALDPVVLTVGLSRRF